jgi:dipeptidyl aminopeptidase/acylaminoacyl peptidase
MTLNRLRVAALLVIVVGFQLIPRLASAQKPKLTLDKFFEWVEIRTIKISPDGHAVAIATERPDWKNDSFLKQIWLYREDAKNAGTLIPLTQSGSDWGPQWSPDGRWIAFLSSRKPPNGMTEKPFDNDSEKEQPAQLYVISLSGGEPIPVTEGEEEVHCFAWSSDSKTLFFATRTPWSGEQKQAYKEEWNDVLRFRESERGDVIDAIAVSDALASVPEKETQSRNKPEQADAKKTKETAQSAGSRTLATSNYRVSELLVSPDGRRLAFSTSSISERQEDMRDFELYLLDMGQSSAPAQPRQITHNEATEQNLRWAPDSRHLLFRVELGSIEGKYKEVQARVYDIDTETGETTRWAPDFPGYISSADIATDGALIGTGGIGTQQQVYSQPKIGSAFQKLSSWPGTYEKISAARNSPRVAFVYSTLQKPNEVYLVDRPENLKDARPITAFNSSLAQSELPAGRTYNWKADDGAPVEGMLIYPPGQFGAKHLPMFTFIHGGPQGPDGDHFEADWYVWGQLAAADGWLVFEPNYRGSDGYGDKFMTQVVPHMVSRPGKDILAGVDALVRDGIADPDHLVIGGYSYGGYLTDWLITQTTRFKAAVTGAGAIENAANWGNDDTTFEDQYYLGGRPWEVPGMYNQEAALWQIDKVKTPTHIVAGADDVRVSVLEDYLLERALHSLGVPSTLLIFPGEGHELDKNPWHSKIKVREELKWLDKYGR